MATQIINQFSQFDLTEAESLAGQCLSITQQQVIQNMLAGLSIEKTNLLYPANNHMGYVQQEAELTGKIGILRQLLDNSAQATDEILNAAQNQQD